MSTTYQTPLRPKPGARAQRVTPQPEPRSQPVTNRKWFEQRRKAREADVFEKLFGKLLGRVKG